MKRLLKAIRAGHRRIAQIRLLNSKRRKMLRQLERESVPHPLAMFDSTDPSQIPSSAPAVAGYVGGAWPTFKGLGKEFPKARRLSIAVSSSESALCLDVEPGDATNSTAVTWAKRELHKKSRRLVWLYTSVSNVDPLLAALRAGGVDLSKVLIWSAHYTFHAHLCGPHSCGETSHDCQATQWTDHSLGRTLDQSLVSGAAVAHLLPAAG
jgi:hypothetical protein